MKGPEPGQSLSHEEIKILITIERTGAGCSMVAIVLTILSYWLVKKLRTTPNLFLLFASIANAGASIASMMGYDGLERGQGSTLCQAQAFIFEWLVMLTMLTGSHIDILMVGSCNQTLGGLLPWRPTCTWFSSTMPIQAAFASMPGFIALSASVDR